MIKEYRTVERISPTSIVLKEVCGVKCGESAEIILMHNGDIRHGIVTLVDGDSVRILVFEGTSKMKLSQLKVRFKGRGLALPLSRELLGRCFRCLGDPADAGERMLWGNMTEVYRMQDSSEPRLARSGAHKESFSVLDGKGSLSLGQSITLITHSRTDAIGDGALDIIKMCYAERRESEFALVLAIMGAGAGSDADSLRSRLGAELGDRTVTFVAPVEESPCERILLPRVAMTAADHFAFDLGMDVLVVMLGINEYAEAYRGICFAEKAAAHGGVRDEKTLLELCDASLERELVQLFEYAGTKSGKKGSLTLLSVLSPDDSYPMPEKTVRRLSEVCVELSKE